MAYADASETCMMARATFATTESFKPAAGIRLSSITDARQGIGGETFPP